MVNNNISKLFSIISPSIKKEKNYALLTFALKTTEVKSSIINPQIRLDTKTLKKTIQSAPPMKTPIEYGNPTINPISKPCKAQ